MTDLQNALWYRKELEKAEAEVTRLREEIRELRSYCTLTFGESHPEIKVCKHQQAVKELLELLELFNKPKGEMLVAGFLLKEAKQLYEKYKGVVDG